MKGKVKASGAAPERSIWRYMIRASLPLPCLESSLSCVFHFPAMEAVSGRGGVVMHNANFRLLMTLNWEVRPVINTHIF